MMNPQQQAEGLEPEQLDADASAQSSNLASNMSHASTMDLPTNTQEPGGIGGSAGSQSSSLDRLPADAHEEILRVSSREENTRFHDGIYRVLPEFHTKPDRIQVELSVADEVTVRRHLALIASF